ncbi:Penicillin-binding protein 1B, partial [Haemophilus influenzae]
TRTHHYTQSQRSLDVIGFRLALR